MKKTFIILLNTLLLASLPALASFIYDGATDNVNMNGNLTASWLFGNLNASYIQNPPWLTTVDISDNTNLAANNGVTLTGDTLSADTSYTQKRITGSCGLGSSIRVVNVDGTVTCETDDDTTLSQEQVQDYAWNVLAGTQTHITVAYQDTTNDVDFIVSDDWYDTAADVIAGFTGCTGTKHLAADGACYTDQDTTYTTGDDWILLSATTITFNETKGNMTWVHRNDWTSIDDYPTACGAGEFVRALGDTLTCATDQDTTYTNGTGLLLSGTEFSANCIAITGSADLCDGSDDGTSYTFTNGLKESGGTAELNTSYYAQFAALGVNAATAGLSAGDLNLTGTLYASNITFPGDTFEIDAGASDLSITTPNANFSGKISAVGDVFSQGDGYFQGNEIYIGQNNRWRIQDITGSAGISITNMDDTSGAILKLYSSQGASYHPAIWFYQNRSQASNTTDNRVYTIGTVSNRNSGNALVVRHFTDETSGALIPYTDNTMSLGVDAWEWKDVWATDTSINSADIAENHFVNDSVEAGDVVCMTSTGDIQKCTTAYDPKVLGVVSTKPGIVMNSWCDFNKSQYYDASGNLTISASEMTALRLQACQNYHPIALAGLTYVKVDCSTPIHIGDILVSSTTPGVAQSMYSATPSSLAQVWSRIGSDFGKAKQECLSGTGVIQVWI